MLHRHNQILFVEFPNTLSNNNSSDISYDIPYILEVKKVPYRFSVKINSDNTMDLQFGNGTMNGNDEILIPNSKNVGLGLANSVQRLNQGIDPSNFLKTNTLGIAPNNKTLLIKYLTGGGVTSNVNAGDLTSISRLEFEEDLLSISDDLKPLYNTYKKSIAIENSEAAVGGKDSESIEEIRQNALAMFGSQNRAVTRQDYMVRAVSMPARYGSVAKVYVSPDGEIDNNSPSSILSSPQNIAEFTNLVDGLKNSSKTDIQKELVKYLSQKKTSISEVNNPFAIINLLDGFIINIGVDFEIIVYSNFNKREVLTNCLAEMQNYFNIDNWTFNKPINISELELILANVEGVMSVPSVKISNLCGGDGNYSPNRYNIDAATKGKIVYPSLDPSIFEVKFPNKDIKGRAL